MSSVIITVSNIATSLCPTNTEGQENSYLLLCLKKEKKCGISNHHAGCSRGDILLWTLMPDKMCQAVVFRHWQWAGPQSQRAGLAFVLDLWQFSDSDVEEEPKQRHGDIAEVRRQRLDFGVSEAQSTCRAGYRKGGNSTYCLGEGVEISVEFSGDITEAWALQGETPCILAENSCHGVEGRKKKKKRP